MAGNVSPVLMMITSATASGGSILPMAAVSSNASYALQFEGPSLKCNRAKGFILRFINEMHTKAGSAISSNAGGEAIYFGVTAPHPTFTATLPHYQISSTFHIGTSPRSLRIVRQPPQDVYIPQHLTGRLPHFHCWCALAMKAWRAHFKTHPTMLCLGQPKPPRTLYILTASTGQGRPTFQGLIQELPAPEQPTPWQPRP